MPRALPAALLRRALPLPGAMPKRRAAEEGSPPATPAASAAPRKRGASGKAPAAREAPAAVQEGVASGVAAAEEEERAFAERGDGARVRIATSGFTLPQKRYWALFNCLEARASRPRLLLRRPRCESASQHCR